ncbi:FAD-dependent monooxygenase [Nonomuraea longicatena]|uniref:FAD-dependent monooxygenase n=1 Tax=Nonomuraea longicatena TaxID=83682 RepID=A0ABP3Z228_9ACTN
MRVLISGASVSGPLLAYWLNRYGFDVTVVERAPSLRKTGGHGVDLFSPAMEIMDRMGLAERVKAAETGTSSLVYRREGRRPVRVEMSRVFAAVSDRHVEIMRDDLSEILYEHTRHDVEYVFGDSIAEITGDGEVRFDSGSARRFDLVVGADGLHSNTRRLTFGQVREEWIGAYLAVASVPDHLGLDGEMDTTIRPGRMAGIYSSRTLPDARALFLFSTDEPLDYHYRDVDRQRELLREAFAGMGGNVPKLVDAAARAEVFYFDEISQLRMDTWSRGRVTLVGDAAYCPGPAVGGSTSLAVVGAYVLAGELAANGGDHERAYPAYEKEIFAYVQRSRAMALKGVRRVIPRTRSDVLALTTTLRLVNVLPLAVNRALARLGSGTMRPHDGVVVKDYRFTG